MVLHRVRLDNPVYIRILLHISTSPHERYDVNVPNKTIYVSDGDLPLFQRAQELAGDNLSAAITAALRRFVEVEEGRQEGFDEITVRVGPRPGRKVRFIGVLLGEWLNTSPSRVDNFHVYRGRTGKYVLYVEHSPDFAVVGKDGKPSWRANLGLDWSASYGSTPDHATLDVLDTLDELFLRIPSQLYDMVAGMANQPNVEELDV
jgi:EXLDI family protein